MSLNNKGVLLERNVTLVSKCNDIVNIPADCILYIYKINISILYTWYVKYICYIYIYYVHYICNIFISIYSYITLAPRTIVPAFPFSSCCALWRTVCKHPARRADQNGPDLKDPLYGKGAMLGGRPHGWKWRRGRGAATRVAGWLGGRLACWLAWPVINVYYVYINTSIVLMYISVLQYVLAPSIVC